METRLRQFSDFVRDLNARSRESDATSLLGWSVRALSDILGFDSAWYGWAQISPDGPIIHANMTHNLPSSYYSSWKEMSAQDLLVAQFQQDPCQVPTYDRSGAVHTDGMRHLSDTYSLKKMATAMNLRPGRAASLWMSAYRGGDFARAWSQADCEFLQCAIDQMAEAVRLSQTRHEIGTCDDACSLLINSQGVVLLGLASVYDQFGHIWSQSDEDRVPRRIAQFIDQPGEHLLIDMELVAHCEPVGAGTGLQKLSLRPLQKFDLLTKREQLVARVLAQGMSHKEAARTLGIAPSTIRNQTQSIYQKLDVDNRASLAASVPG